ncbi:hypothetical protein CYMTET_39462 [Cymbomonas tetramitiformis]|uniref:Uncharacterized protein n=1 Tax=Cymbomonas tetramitiformis TaxID=36881 RepID=A0AAE0CA17_9CHLO|nr:hypothetical protein CYMTET_39462 [Cymbomonas tetramitiformis]
MTMTVAELGAHALNGKDQTPLCVAASEEVAGILRNAMSTQRQQLMQAADAAAAALLAEEEAESRANQSRRGQKGRRSAAPASTSGGGLTEALRGVSGAARQETRSTLGTAPNVESTMQLIALGSPVSVGLNQSILHPKGRSGPTPAERVAGIGRRVQAGSFGQRAKNAHKHCMSQGLKPALGILSSEQGAIRPQTRVQHDTPERLDRANGGARNSQGSPGVEPLPPPALEWLTLITTSR